MPRKKSRTKLLVSIIQPKDAQLLAETINDISRSLSIAVAAEGTARSNLIDYLGLGSPEKTVVFSIIPEVLEKKIMSKISSELKMYMVGRGIAFLIPLTSISKLLADGINKDIQIGREVKKEMNETAKKEDSAYELIIANFGEDVSDKVIEAARNAGASGGTIIHSRTLESMGIGQAVGVSFRQATEILLIITKKNRRNEIMKAVREAGGLKTSGAGIVFSVPVSAIAGVGVSMEEFESEELS